ncbi:MAG: FMN-binding protein [Bacteroidales bacterium]|nr:FMN-binding protein [Candidatus Cacconaster merdequi]
MNTNSNVYTVIYTTVIVVIVAAVLAFVSQSLKPMQEANEKAETISQILTAAQFGEKDHWQEIGNAATIKFFEENVEGEPEIVSPAALKALNYKIKDNKEGLRLPSYTFNNGVTVIPVYGAGLWGPVWGFIALDTDFQTIVGAYFDHESETPGLGGKIKDDPSFRALFKGKKVDFNDAENPFDIVKNGTAKGLDMTSKIDAISGATMTSNGLDAAIDTWLGSYVPSLKMAQEMAAKQAEEAAAAEAETENVEE